MRSEAGPALPYTDVFKLCKVDQWPAGGNHTKQGDVRLEVDRSVGRVVVQLAGAVPSASSLTLPQSRAASLALPGRFLYFQLQLSAAKTYAIHVELTTEDKNLHRLTISNVCKDESVRMKRSGIHVFMPAEDDAWALLALDLHELAQRGCKAPFKAVKSLQLCANMAVRTVFSSNIKYGWESLPRDLCLTAAFDTASAKVVWIPEEPTQDVQAAVLKRRPAVPLPPVPKQPSKGGSSWGAASVSTQPPDCGEEEPPWPAHQPSPIMQLQHMSAFSGEFSRAVLSAGDATVFPAGSAIVAMASSGKQQRLLGHTRPVVALALNSTGRVLASAEEGSGGCIKLWDLATSKCFSTLDGHAGGVVCLDLSPDGHRLVSTGVDSHGRQEVVLTDVSQCGAGGKAAELARHVSDYNIKCIKFVPHEPEKIVACGKNAIRVFRIKDGQLRGVSIPMDGVQALRKPYSCGTLADPACTTVGEVFTDIAFEHDPQLLPISTRRMYVATLSGALYQVNIDMRAVEAVYQLHADTINSISLRHGFCATGCSQGMLRVWGLDFDGPYMETQLDGPVSGVAFSNDGLQIAAGTATGVLCVLEVNGRKCTTVLRSHTGSVHAVAVEPSGQQLYTASADGTVRAWDSATRQQLLEFFAPKERALCVVCHPSKAELACGFQSGTVRVFDVAAATMAQECSQHQGAARQVLYAQRGHVLLSIGEDGTVCVYDARRKYLPLRYLSLGAGLAATCMAVSQDGRTIAVGVQAASSKQAAVILSSAASMDPKLQFPLPSASNGSSQAAAAVQLHFLPDAGHILSVTRDGRLLGHSCSDGSMLLCMPGLHGGQCTASALDKSGTFLLTGGTDRLVEVWSLHALHTLQQQQQQQVCAFATAEAGVAGAGGGGGTAGGSGCPVLRSLPSQTMAGHPGAVLSIAFLGGSSGGGGGSSAREVVSVGAQGELCFWSFFGQPCNAYPAGPCDTTTSTVVVAPPLTACEAAAMPAEAAGSTLLNAGSPPQLPRNLPSSSAQCLAGCAASQGCDRADSPMGVSPSADCATPRRPPFWEQQEQPCTLQVTAGRKARTAQLVPLQQKLVISSPGPGSSCRSRAGEQAPRSAQWAWEEEPGARVPAYRPEDQLQLMPPAAAVQHVYGFSAAAGFGWDAGQRCVALAAGNVLVLDDLKNSQRPVAFMPSAITAVAASSAGGWLAAATEPVGGGGGANITLHNLDGHGQRCVLQCHQEAVTALVPSPDGSWLASVGSAPGPLLVLWDAARGELVAVGQEEAQPAAAIQGVAWLAGTQQPTFYTVGTDGLSVWVLGSSALTMEEVPLPAALHGVGVTAVACKGEQRPDGSCSLLLGDGKGRVWALEVSASQDITSFALLSELQEESITAINSATADAVGVGTAKGMVVVLQQAGGSWEMAGCHQLDGAVSQLLSTQPAGGALLAATQASTLWLLRKGSAEVLLCGHRHAITGMQYTPGLMATSSLAGLHVWQMDELGGNARAPLVEFCEPGNACCVSIAHNHSCAASGHASGAVSLFDLHTNRLRWRVAALQQQPVVGVAVLQRLRAIRVMVVYRNGAMYILDGSTGSVLQHVQQYMVAEAAVPAGEAAAPASRAGRPSHNFPLAGLVVNPADNAHFVLLGEGRAVVCKATWAKHSGCQTLARLQPAGQLQEALLPATTAAAGQGLRTPAVVFSTAHAGHLYCAFPSQQPATIQLHDCATGGIVKTTPVVATGGAITALAVSAQDELLAVGCAGGTLLLMWGDTEAWSELAGHAGPVTALAFSRCGTKLYSVAGGGSTVFVWDIKG